jgi:hypothetical protein
MTSKKRKRLDKYIVRFLGLLFHFMDITKSTYIGKEA